MTNVTILDVFRTHVQKDYGKVLEMKSNYILDILALCQSASGRGIDPGS